MVANNAEDLQNDLQHQIDRLRVQSQDTNDLVHIANHEIKNVLSLMIGYVQHLQRHYSTRLDKTANDFLEEMNHSGFQIRNILESVQAVLYAQAMPLDPKPLEMAHIIQAAKQRLLSAITLSDAEISEPHVWPRVIGDANAIQSVWQNLLSNAIQYGGQPPLISLGAAEHQDPSHNIPMIRFWCQDNGRGISPGQRDKLFRPQLVLSETEAVAHEQSRQAILGEQKESSPHVGVGLYIARQIIESHGGKIWAENVPEHGAKISFTLPAVH